MGVGCWLGLALYTMSSVLVFATWMVVGAVPCQDLASVATGAPPKQAQWAALMSALQERIVQGKGEPGARTAMDGSRHGWGTGSRQPWMEALWARFAAEIRDHGCKPSAWRKA